LCALLCVLWLTPLGVHPTDLKPENLMLLDEMADDASSQPSLRLKVIDYGTAGFCEEGQHLHSKIGTARYVAPEVSGLSV